MHKHMQSEIQMMFITLKILKTDFGFKVGI